MIIKVVELVEEEQHTEYSDDGIVKKQKRYRLVENFVNTALISSFREIDKDRYDKKGLPEGLMDEQQFTYISLSASSRGLVVVESPESLQEKINTISVLGRDPQNLLRG